MHEYKIKKNAFWFLIALLGCVVFYRFIEASIEFANGNQALMVSYAFTVILPASFALFLFFYTPPTKSIEGVYMKIGTVVQMMLIISFKEYSLHLFLGLPVVFLFIEIFVTKFPKRLQLYAERLFIFSH